MIINALKISRHTLHDIAASQSIISQWLPRGLKTSSFAARYAAGTPSTSHDETVISFECRRHLENFMPRASAYARRILRWKAGNFVRDGRGDDALNITGISAR